MTPQTTGASAHTEVGAMDELHARLRMQGTPRTKRSDRRRARELPSTPSLDKFDMAAFANDDAVDDATGLSLADMAAKMLNQLEDGSPTPPPRRLIPSLLVHEETEENGLTVPEPMEADTLTHDLPEVPMTPEHRPDPASLITPPDRQTSGFPLGLGIQTPQKDKELALDSNEPEQSPSSA